MEHKIVETHESWEFEGSHGRTSTNLNTVLQCSCGWTETFTYREPKLEAQAVIDHKLNVLANAAGITFTNIKSSEYQY
jgi:hypothetical protein